MQQVRVRSLAGLARQGRAFLVAGVLVLLPAVLLAALGVRTLVQDARLAEAQARERLDRAAMRAVLDLERGLGLWDRAVAVVSAGTGAAPLSVPRLIADVLDGSPDAVIVRVDSKGWNALPAGRLLYTFEPRPLQFRVEEIPRALLPGDDFEIRQQDYARAAEAYRALLHSPDLTLRPWVLLRLARTEAKAGRREEALRLYEALEREKEALIGDLPADLVAGVQRCELTDTSRTSDELTRAAFPFYRSLTSGRWRLEKPRYLHYSERARRWLEGVRGTDRQTRDDLTATEQRKIRLTDAVGDISGTILTTGAPSAGHRLFTFSSRQYLAVWQSTQAGPGSVLLVLGETTLRSRVWPPIMSAGAADDIAASLVAPAGTVIFATEGTPTTPGASITREQTFQDGDFLWRVRMTPRRPDGLYPDVTRRRWLYLAMLVVMVGGLLAAGLVVGRTLNREIEIARLKSQFVAAVSHEFRSPLTGISQLSELLVGGKVTDDARRQHYYELIHSESRRLSRLVEHVLDVARTDEGRKEYRFERVETSGWVRALADEFQRTPAAEGKTVVVTVPEGLPPLIVDPPAMAGALHNLLDNAVKYSPGKDMAWLEASATAGGTRVAISVRDEGVGIPSDEQRHLFERFFRGRQLADAVAGTGLGLSLVKHVVSAHGGEISVASTPGVGTTITAVLPVGRDT